MFDFYSDTKTKPTKEMLQAAIGCEVGDEQQHEDPTTLELCRRVAVLLGKEAAIFLPSGTMCNVIAVRVHTNPGDEIVCEKSCHIMNSEVGGAAAINGVMMQPILGKNGVFEDFQVKEVLRSESRHAPKSTLVCVEQTANMGGGAIWPVKKLDEVALAAKKAGLATHMDGARLFNAVVKTGISAKRFARYYDSVWIDFSKGLGAPIGAVLCGSENFITKAWRYKQQLGGAMRQSGVITALCLYSLENHIDRLADDHKLATMIGKEIEQFELVRKVLPIQTNIIIFDLKANGPSAEKIISVLQKDGIVVGAFGEKRIRIVTHMGVNSLAAEALLDSLQKHLRK